MNSAIESWMIVFAVLGMLTFVSVLVTIIGMVVASVTAQSDVVRHPASEAIAPTSLTPTEVDELIGTTLPGLPPEQRNLINMTLTSVANEGAPLRPDTVLDAIRTALPEIPAEHVHLLGMAIRFHLKERAK